MSIRSLGEKKRFQGCPWLFSELDFWGGQVQLLKFLEKCYFHPLKLKSFTFIYKINYFYWKYCQRLEDEQNKISTNTKATDDPEYLEKQTTEWCYWPPRFLKPLPSGIFTAEELDSWLPEPPPHPYGTHLRPGSRGLPPDSGSPVTWAALLGLLHNCGWRYFSQGSLNKDSRDKFLLKFSSRKCLVSAAVYMLPVVRTWKRYNSVSFSYLSN